MPAGASGSSRNKDQLCGGIRSDHLDLADERRFCKVCGVLLASVWTPMKLLHSKEKFRLRLAAPSELRKFRPDKFSCHGNHGPSYGYSRPIERPVAVPAKLSPQQVQSISGPGKNHGPVHGYPFLLSFGPQQAQSQHKSRRRFFLGT